MHYLVSLLVLLMSVSAHAGEFTAAGFTAGSIQLRNAWAWEDGEVGGVLNWDSMRHAEMVESGEIKRELNSALATWKVNVDPAGFCRLTVCMEAAITTPAQIGGIFSRTGASIQLWNQTGVGPRVPADLGAVNVYRSGGYRGQVDSDECWMWEGPMAKGKWQIRAYIHKVRNDRNRPIAQPDGVIRVDSIVLERLE